MARIYSYRWTRIYNESFDDAPEEARKDWIRETINLTPEGWERALETCRRKAREAARQDLEAWPPSITEFAVFAEDKMPNAEMAYIEMMKYMNSPEHRRKPKDLSTLVYHTYTQNLDPYTFKQMPADAARRAFMAAYKVTLSQLEKGVILCEPKEQAELPKPIVTPKAKKQGEQVIDRLKGMFE